EDGIRDFNMTGVQTCALPISLSRLFTYRHLLAGGLTLGEDISSYKLYRTGGIFEQNLGNFFALQGYQFGEHSTRNILIAANTLRSEDRRVGKEGRYR